MAWGSGQPVEKGRRNSRKSRCVCAAKASRRCPPHPPFPALLTLPSLPSSLSLPCLWIKQTRVDTLSNQTWIFFQALSSQLFMTYDHLLNLSSQLPSNIARKHLDSLFFARVWSSRSCSVNTLAQKNITNTFFLIICFCRTCSLRIYFIA